MCVLTIFAFVSAVHVYTWARVFESIELSCLLEIDLQPLCISQNFVHSILGAVALLFREIGLVDPIHIAVVQVEDGVVSGKINCKHRKTQLDVYIAVIGTFQLVIHCRMGGFV